MTDAYAAAGVDTHAGDLAVELMKRAVGATHNDMVVGGLGGFAGMMDVSFLKNYDRPLLATSTDGVGTKLKIAIETNIHDTIGIDLVATGGNVNGATHRGASIEVIPDRSPPSTLAICTSAGVSYCGPRN